MRDQKLLFLTVLVVVLATGTYADFFGGLKEGFSNFGDSVRGWGEGVGDSISGFGKRALEKMNKWKDAAMEKFMNALPDRVKEWVRGGDYSDANVDELVESMPKKAWNVMKLEQLTTLGPEKFNELITKGKGKLPPRILGELERIRDSNVTKEQAIEKLQTATVCKPGEGNDECTVSRPVAMALVSKLGNPGDLTVENITAFGKDMVLNLPPPFIRGIKNETALKKVKEFLDTCVSSSGGNCPKKGIVQGMIKDINMKLHKHPKMWNKTIITDMGGVSALDPMDIAMLSPATLKSVKSEVTSREFKMMPARKIIRSFAKAENVNQMDATATVSWLDSMNKLQQFCLPRDVSPSVLGDTNVMKVFTDNLKKLANKDMLPARASKGLLKDILKGKTADTMTEQDVTEAAPMLGDASPGLIKKLVKGGKLKGANLRVMGDNFKMNGPGAAARGQTILTALRQENSDLSTVPASLVRFLDVDELSQMPTQAIQNYLQESKGKSWRLDDSQKDVVLRQVQDKSSLPPDFKDLIPSDDYKDEDATTIRRLAEGMPQESALAMKLSTKAYGGKSKLSKSDFANNVEDANYMIPADAAKINVNDVPDILKSLAENDVTPPMDTCTALGDKLMEYAKMDRDVEDEEELAQSMTYEEVMQTPPCVIASLGEDALESMFPGVKPVLLEKMGQSDNSMSISRSMRQQIVKDGLGPVDKMPMIPPEISAMLGSAKYDLPPEALEKLPPEDAEMFLKDLNMLFAEGKGCCLDEGQKKAITEMATKVYGPPRDLDTMADVCCLQGIIEDSWFNMVPLDVFASCTCQRNVVSQSEVDARETMCKSQIGEKEVEKIEKAREMFMMKQEDAALATLEDLNARRRRKRAAAATACETAAIGGAAALSVSEIKAMTNESVLGCIYELAQVEIEDKDKRRATFDRIKTAKNNKLGDLSKEEMLQMKNLWPAMKKDEVMELPTITEGTMDGVVVELGKDLDFEEETLKEVSKKVLTDWKGAKDMTGEDLTFVRQLVCGFNSTTIEALKANEVLKAMPTLKKLSDDSCPKQAKVDLAKRAVAGYGAVTTWDAATVYEWGSLLGSVDPEKLKDIPPAAMAGITVEGIESIPADAIKVMKVAQIENLPVSVVGAISDDQMDGFNSEMREALEKKQKQIKKSGTAEMVASLGLCLVLLVSVLVVG